MLASSKWCLSTDLETSDQRSKEFATQALTLAASVYAPLRPARAMVCANPLPDQAARIATPAAHRFDHMVPRKVRQAGVRAAGSRPDGWVGVGGGGADHTHPPKGRTGGVGVCGLLPHPRSGVEGRGTAASRRVEGSGGWRRGTATSTANGNGGGDKQGRGGSKGKSGGVPS